MRKTWWKYRARRRWHRELGPRKRVFQQLGVEVENGNFKKMYRAGLMDAVDQESIIAARRYQAKTLGRTLDPVLHIASHNLLGHADPRLIPRCFSRDELLPGLNDMGFRAAYSDKNLYDQLVPTRDQPETTLKCAAGNVFDCAGRAIDAETSVGDLLDPDEDYIIKPSRSDNGESVAKIRQHKGKVELGETCCRTIRDIRQYYGNNFIVQRRLKQHSVLAEPHLSSINTIRVLTLRWKRKIHVLMAFLRVGSGDGVQDNIGTGGLGVGIQPHGQLYSYAISNSLEKTHHHPTSHYDFTRSRTIPGFDDATHMCRELHERVLHHNLVSWDIAIDPEANPIFLEYNFVGALWLYQLVVGKPLLGDLSDEVIREFRQGTAGTS